MLGGAAIGAMVERKNRFRNTEPEGSSPEADRRQDA
jgi:hypothetical protein